MTYFSMLKTGSALAATGLFAATALAGPGNSDKNKTRGYDKHERYEQTYDRYDRYDRRDRYDRYDRDARIYRMGAKDCPPGLRDKGCMPPGQAKKYQIGQRLPDDYRRFTDYRRYDLPPPRDGYYYSRVDNDILLVSEATRNVAELVTIIDILTD